jgi:hypothetical protein
LAGNGFDPIKTCSSEQGFLPLVFGPVAQESADFRHLIASSNENVRMGIK